MMISIFANRVSLMLQQRNISQEQLALHANIDRGHVSTILSGKGNPTMKTMEKIADALQTPLWQLLMPITTPHDKWRRLQTLLSDHARQFGDGVEVTDRRGTGIVGISIFANNNDQYPTTHCDWMDDLDGQLIDDALQMAMAYIYHFHEQADRTKNEK